MEWRWSRLPPADWQDLASDGRHAAQNLGRKQEEAIAALLSQRNIEDAARVAGVGVRTLLRWLKLPEFDAAYREARRKAFSAIDRTLQQGIHGGGDNSAEDHA